MSAMRRRCGDGARAGRAAPRRYTDHELVEIATRARTRGFDAPRHLVTLITDLNAFADYATQCLTESNDAPMYDRLRGMLHTLARNSNARSPLRSSHVEM